MYSRRRANQLLLKSLMKKMSKAEKLLIDQSTNDLSTTTFDELTDKVSKARKYLPGFTLTPIGVQQYYRKCKNSKTDKELLDNLKEEIKDLLLKLKTVRSRKEIQFEVIMAVQAIASPNLCVNTEPNGPKPMHPVTAFKVEARDGELMLKWKDEKNDDCIRYDIKLCEESDTDRLYDVQPHITFYSLNDRAVRNWKMYSVAVRPVNNSGAGPYCESIECLNATIPSVPSRLKIINPTSNTSVKLSCHCPQIEDVTACIVKGVIVDDFEVPIVERNGKLATIEVKGLCDANTEFNIQLKFKNMYGVSEKYSHPLKVKMSTFIPSPPDNFVLSPVASHNDDFILSPKAGDKQSMFGCSGLTDEAKLESRTSSTSKESLDFTSFPLMVLMKWFWKFPFLVLKLAWSYKTAGAVVYSVLSLLMLYNYGFSIENVAFWPFNILFFYFAYILLATCVSIIIF